MRRNLIILAVVAAILLSGAVAMLLSVRQDKERKELATPAALAPANLGQPTPTLQTGPSNQAAAQATVMVTHIVGAGDTLLGIALSYDVSVEEIISANEMVDP